ncbi:MAG: hypothetical protein FWF04_03235, partial [Clostridiales bacterium]|nr:hypothetical protein [Clostridiales bacterium]
MKKKLTRLFLLFIITCLAACNLDKIPEYTLSAEDIQTVDLPPTTESPPIEILTPSYDATIEYGDPDLITDNTGPLWAYIRFPIAGDETDDIITEWAHSVYQNACDEIAGLCKGDPQAEGEINVQFDSYLVNGRYAGILENGMFMTSHLAHPLSIVRTFNIDTKSKVFLENSDILDHSRLESIFSVMRDRITEELPDAADYLGEMDEKWLNHIAIGHDGIIVVLERGMFLPAYLGAQKVVLPYEQLGSAFLLGAAPKPPSEPPVAPPAGPPAGPHPAEPPMKSPTTPPTAPPVGPSVGSPATETPAAPATDPPAETPEAPAPEPPAETPEAPAPEPPANPAIRDNIDPLKPMIALTFDDVPSKHTPKILDT